MECQDWKPVVLKKKIVEKKKYIQPDENYLKMKKVENEEINKIDKIDKVKSKDFILLRNKLNLTQNELAVKLNIKVDVIRDIENGSFPNNKSYVNNLMVKMNKMIKY